MESITKRCRKCNTSRPLEMFSKATARKDGLRSTCKSCTSAYMAERRLEKHEELDAKHRLWCERNPEKKKASDKRVYDRMREAHPDRHRERCRIAARKHYWGNLDKCREMGRQWYYAHPEEGKLNARKRAMRLYGLTIEGYQALVVAQNGVCAICHKEDKLPGKDGKPRQLAVDHNHITGKVRGLLCFHCNTTLGKIGEDVNVINRMAAYITEHNDK